MKVVRRTMPGTMLRAFSIRSRKIARAAALHALEHCGRGVLQRDVEVFGDVVVAGDGFEQARGDLVGVGVEEAQPAQAGQDGEGVEELARPSLRPRSSP
jgi:hypothetical protein